jgi:hypothetical protein
VIPRIARTPRAFARAALHGAFRAVGIAVALAFVAACAPGDRPAEDRASQAFTPTQGAALPSFLARMPEAPFTTALSGVRRASFFWSTSAGESRLVHEERVAADGQGRFLVEPLVVHEPAMTSEQAQLFALLQKNREGFLWRWRDFRIRDLSLFEQNWQLEVVGERTVAERLGVVVEVRRRDLVAHLVYRASIDPATGLVLAHEEFDQNGKLVAHVEFTHLVLNPTFDNPVWHQAPFDGDELRPGDEGAAQLGASPATPQALPLGYQLVDSQVLAVPGRRVLRRTYTDGIDSLFFLQTVLPEPEMEQVSIGPEAPRKALHMRAGPWVACDYARPRDKVMIVGRLDDQQLLHLLRSVR